MATRIQVVAERDPAKLPWRRSAWTWCWNAPACSPARRRPARTCRPARSKVIISAPGEKDVDRTVRLRREPQDAQGADTVISNASCTTNCLAPLVKAIDDRIGVVSGLMNTIHSFTNDQVLTDVFHKDLRRARAAGHNMIPTKTGAAAAVGLVLPHLNGKLDGFSIRVPTINVSIVDLTFVAKKPTTVEEVNRAVKQAADGDLKGILEYSTEPLVSSDFNHNPASSIFDAGLTRVSEGTLVKVAAWYDNEWGFSNRMLDVAARCSPKSGPSQRSNMKFKRMSEVDLRGKRVFIRCDLNVPIEDGRITDDTRIRASVPGIKAALEQGAAVMVTSHLGRPTEGELEPEDSLAPVAQRLSELLESQGAARARLGGRRRGRSPARW